MSDQPHGPPKPKQLRGFALMKLKDPEKFAQVSRDAGARSQSTGHGYRWNKKDCRKWGRKGGLSRWKWKKQ